jgi:exonuclease III
LELGGDVELNPGPKTIRKCLNICHVNVRSLSRSKFLATQVSLANVYDFITISETRLHQGVGHDLFALTGYHDILRNDRKGDGGDAMFRKKHYFM